MSEPLPPDVLRALSAPGASDRLDVFADRLSYFGVVSSTNDIAMDLLAAGVPDGTAVLASHQTAGRGRRGRSWFSPGGAGLYLSVVMHDVASALITLLAGVAAAEGVREATGAPVELEWPNDLVVEPGSRHGSSLGRLKVGGILSETPGGSRSAVVGLGVNLASTTYPEEIQHRASSLEAHVDTQIDRGTVLLEILASLAVWRRRSAVDGGTRMLERWRELSPSSVGARVTWTAAGGECGGVTDGIEPDGALRVRTEVGVERLIGGTLTWLPELDAVNP